MNITLPLYVRLHRNQYTVRPLVFHGPVARHEKLEGVLHLSGAISFSILPLPAVPVTLAECPTSPD